MGGSQPPARGELHPTRTLRRAAFQPRASLCHPLILDGFSSTVAFRLRQTSACTFYLVFKEPGRALRLVDRSRAFPPSLSPSGEPSNLTRRFRFVSTPRRSFSFG